MMRMTITTIRTETKRMIMMMITTMMIKLKANVSQQKKKMHEK